MFRKDPSIKEFKELFDSCAKEVSVNGETVDSHSKIPANVYVTCSNSNDSFRIVDLEIDHLFGCGCPGSITIVIEKE